MSFTFQILNRFFFFLKKKQRFLNVTHRQMLTHRSSQNAQATCIRWCGQAEQIKNSLETGQPTILQERRQYCAITTSTVPASLDTKQDCKIPQSFGSGLRMRKTKNICRLNGNLCCHSLFLFFFLPCIPQSSVPHFSSSTMDHLEREKGGKISKDNRTLKWNLAFMTANMKRLLRITSLKTLSDVTWMLTSSDFLRSKKF